MVFKGNKIYTFFMSMVVVFLSGSSVFATKNNYWCTIGGVDEKKCLAIITYVDTCLTAINCNEVSVPALPSNVFYKADSRNHIKIGEIDNKPNCLLNMLDTINNKIQSLTVNIENKKTVSAFINVLKNVYSAVSCVSYEDLQKDISWYKNGKAPSVIINFYNAFEKIKQNINNVDQEIRRQEQDAQKRELVERYHRLFNDCTTAISEYKDLPLPERKGKCQSMSEQLAAIAHQLEGIELPVIPQFDDGLAIDSDDAIKTLVGYVIRALHEKIEKSSEINNELNINDIATGEQLLAQAVSIERAVVAAFNDAQNLRNDFCKHLAGEKISTFDKELWELMRNEIIVKFCQTPSLVSKTMQEQDCFGWAYNAVAYDTIKKTEHNVNINSRCGFYGKVIIGVAVTVAVIMYIAFMHSK